MKGKRRLIIIVNGSQYCDDTIELLNSRLIGSAEWEKDIMETKKQMIVEGYSILRIVGLIDADLSGAMTVSNSKLMPNLGAFSLVWIIDWIS